MTVQERVVGLCEGRNLLYVDDLRVETGCMSFVVHDEFILITTVKHACRCIPLHSEPKGGYKKAHWFVQICTLCTQVLAQNLNLVQLATDRIMNLNYSVVIETKTGSPIFGYYTLLQVLQKKSSLVKPLC